MTRSNTSGRVMAALVAAISTAACADATPSADRDYLYVWTSSEDSTQSDFLAVLDVTEDSVQYGRLVTTVSVPGLGHGTHHTEHELATDRLFASGYRSGHTFIFDLDDPLNPRVASEFGDVDGYSHAHSFLRLPNGNVLATFQMRHDADGMTPGGLIEFTNEGRPVRSASAQQKGIDPDTRVYSAAVVPGLDRIVTTTTDMAAVTPASRQIQIWRLSDLSLLNTFTLPDGPDGGESMMTAEPRLLDDGRTVLVSTFWCGLYLMEGLDSDTPSARLVASFPRREGYYCAIPIVVGNYYLVTVPAWSAVVSLDISDPSAPREVSRVTLGPDDVPHWIALSPDTRRVVVTGYRDLRNRVVIAQFDSATGALSIDNRFHEAGTTEPGFRMDGVPWPHGGTAMGVPHGAVFSR